MDLTRFTSSPTRALGSILAVYLVSRVLIVGTAVSPARDGSRYFGEAEELRGGSISDVVRSREDHPGYPLLLAGALAIGERCGVDTPRGRVLLAQSTTAFSGLLLVIAGYALLRRLWGPLLAWSATLAFTVLPRPAWDTSDILSDPLAAASTVFALFLLVRGLDGHTAERHTAERTEDGGRSTSRWPFLAAGGAAALAYWVRFDALVLAASAVAAGGLLAAWPRARAPWAVRPLLGRLLLFASVFALGLVLFRWAWGVWVLKPVAGVLRVGALHSDASPPLAWADLSESGPEIVASLQDILSAVGKEHQYALPALAAIGVLILLARARRDGPTARGVLIACFVVTTFAAVGLVRMRAGYVSSRYTLVLGPLVTGLAFGALEDLRALLVSRLRRPPAWLERRGSAIALGLTLTVAVSAPSLLSRRLHDTAHGTVEAARFVAEHMAPEDTLYERDFFPAYFAGISARNTRRYWPRKRQRGRHWLILRERDLEEAVDLATFLAGPRGRREASFPRRPGDEHKQVVVWTILPGKLPSKLPSKLPEKLPADANR